MKERLLCKTNTEVKNKYRIKIIRNFIFFVRIVTTFLHWIQCIQMTNFMDNFRNCIRYIHNRKCDSTFNVGPTRWSLSVLYEVIKWNVNWKIATNQIEKVDAYRGLTLHNREIWYNIPRRCSFFVFCLNDYSFDRLWLSKLFVICLHRIRTLLLFECSNINRDVFIAFLNCINNYLITLLDFIQSNNLFIRDQLYHPPEVTFKSGFSFVSVLNEANYKFINLLNIFDYEGIIACGLLPPAQPSAGVALVDTPNEWTLMRMENYPV